MKPRMLLVALAMIGLATTARLPQAAADEAEAARLAARGKALRYTRKTTDPPASIDTGGARILVNAPLAAVRAIVTDYGGYAKLVKPFDQSRVLSRKKGVTDVFLRVPVLNGTASIWAVIRVAAPVKDGDGEAIVARLAQGNVDDFRAVWRLHPAGPDKTILSLELLVDPKLPIPASLVTPELASAADKAVTAVQNRAHGQRSGDARNTARR